MIMRSLKDVRGLLEAQSMWLSESLNSSCLGCRFELQGHPADGNLAAARRTVRNQSLKARWDFSRHTTFLVLVILVSGCPSCALREVGHTPAKHAPPLVIQ